MSRAPLRIALISEHASPLATIGSVDAGGQNVYVASVARCLARSGHQVDVLTRRDDPRLPAVVGMYAGVRVLHLSAGPPEFVAKEHLLQHMPAFSGAAQRLFEHGAPYDVIHANFFMSGLVGLRLRWLFSTPLVITFHALGLVRREHQREADAFPPARIGIEQRIVRHADRIVAECPQDRSDLIRLYEARAPRVATVPCGVDLGEFSPGSKVEARRRLGLSIDDFIVLQLGRLVPRKGIDNVIRAIARLDPDLRARLLVVGGESAEPDERATPEIGRLRGVAREYAAGDRVQFVGRRERSALRDFYVAADVFVTTPWYEPFGITPLEAMACGTVVVGSAVGGIQQTVVDGVTGYLVPPRDPESLTQALAYLQANPAHASALGRAGMRRVRSTYTWERVSDELVDVYTSVLHRPQSVRISSAIKQAEPSGACAGHRLGASA